MGVWIEIVRMTDNTVMIMRSLPLWECGLKYKFHNVLQCPDLVTPFMGVWIEIICFAWYSSAITGHSLYGSVD